MVVFRLWVKNTRSLRANRSFLLDEYVPRVEAVSRIWLFRRISTPRAYVARMHGQFIRRARQKSSINANAAGGRALSVSGAWTKITSKNSGPDLSSPTDGSAARNTKTANKLTGRSEGKRKSGQQANATEKRRRCMCIIYTECKNTASLKKYRRIWLSFFFPPGLFCCEKEHITSLIRFLN